MALTEAISTRNVFVTIVAIFWRLAGGHFRNCGHLKASVAIFKFIDNRPSIFESTMATLNTGSSRRSDCNYDHLLDNSRRNNQEAAVASFNLESSRLKQLWPC